uniref:Chaperonin GroEL n=1 Tax=uncultured virus TaxID=340016 RepID=A0A240F748_9VIRU|nr:chaperonin GroEL [uncultured virus]
MKQIEQSSKIQEKILRAVDKIADPVVQTLGPKGGNVLYEDTRGGLYVTNDGVTIAKQVSSDDPVEDAIINVIKHTALQTNQEVGDGTTTSILLARSLIKDGMKALNDGMNPMILKEHLTEFGEAMKKNLKPKLIKNDKDLLNIATISANNDTDIAKDVLRVVKTAGTNGQVFINPSPKPKTEIIEDPGYVIHGGMFSPDYASDGFQTTMENVHVLVTDKRIYHEAEAESIIRTALENGITELVIIARDFIGKAPNLFSANNARGNIKLLLIKEPTATEFNNTRLKDIATYLGGKIVAEKEGKLVNKLSAEDFILAEKVYSSPDKTVLNTKNPFNPELTKLVEGLEKKRDDDKEDKEIEARLASLTNGIVTVNVGGATQIEIQERVFRYEDAINATRSAMKYGVLTGGGLSLYDAIDGVAMNIELQPMFLRYAQSSIRQLALNAGKHPDHIIENTKGDTGYNSKTGKFEDLFKAGVIDPFKVTEMAISNSISIAIAILTSNYIVVNKKEDDKDK